MKDFLEDRFERFTESLNEKEKCVYEEALLKHQSNAEVVRLCWDGPVATARVSQTILQVKEKYLQYVMGYVKDQVEAHLRKNK